ncbi:hypothetical protein [Treponema zioleckii]|uniref:hypothetical protein n=1 Tax=Treponema zioleckii TaxID=331680 RepID=UPI00168ABD04|nr:hypothetical protein [Treponema zioleckii]
MVITIYRGKDLENLIFKEKILWVLFGISFQENQLIGTKLIEEVHQQHGVQGTTKLNILDRGEISIMPLIAKSVVNRLAVLRQLQMTVILQVQYVDSNVRMVVVEEIVIPLRPSRLSGKKNSNKFYEVTNMKFILNKEEIQADTYVLAINGIWIWKDNDWKQQIPCADRMDFFEKSKEQLKKHPDYLDLDELYSK